MSIDGAWDDWKPLMTAEQVVALNPEIVQSPEERAYFESRGAIKPNEAAKEFGPAWGKYPGWSAYRRYVAEAKRVELAKLKGEFC